jgi:hypothetical protein
MIKILKMQKNWVCEQWDGFHCQLATELYGFTQNQQDELIEKCSFACKICIHDFSHLDTPSACKFPFILPRRGIIHSCAETAGYSPYTLAADEVWKDFDRLWCPTILDDDGIYKENQPFRMCYREKFNLLYDHQPCNEDKDCFSENCETIENVKRCIQKKNNVCSTRRDNSRERCPKDHNCNPNGSWKTQFMKEVVDSPCIPQETTLRQHGIADEKRNICIGDKKTVKCKTGEICLPLVPEVCTPADVSTDKAIWLIVLISIFCTIFLLVIGLFFCHYMTKGLKKKYVNLGELLEDDDRKVQIRKRLAWLRAGKILDHGMVPKRSSLPTYGIDKPIEIGRRVSDHTHITIPKSWTFGGTEGAPSQCASTWINGYKPGETGTIGNGKIPFSAASSLQDGTIYSLPHNLGRPANDKIDNLPSGAFSTKTYTPRQSIIQQSTSRSRHYRHPYKEIQTPIRSKENNNDICDDNNNRLLLRPFDPRLPQTKEKVLPLEAVLQRMATNNDIPSSSCDNNDDIISDTSEKQYEENIMPVIPEQNHDQNSHVSHENDSKYSINTKRLGVTMNATSEIIFPKGDDGIDDISMGSIDSIELGEPEPKIDDDIELGLEGSDCALSDISRDMESEQNIDQNILRLRSIEQTHDNGDDLEMGTPRE